MMTASLRWTTGSFASISHTTSILAWKIPRPPIADLQLSRRGVSARSRQVLKDCSAAHALRLGAVWQFGSWRCARSASPFITSFAAVPLPPHLYYFTSLRPCTLRQRLFARTSCQERITTALPLPSTAQLACCLLHQQPSIYATRLATL